MMIEQFLQKCQELVRSHGNADTVLVIQPGKKYHKIVSEARGSRSVFAFVDRSTGDIFKPASWAAPAKHARGNIKDESGGMSRMTQYGPEYLR